MTLELHSVTFPSEDPQRDAQFWGAVLDRRPEPDDGGFLLAGESGQVGLRFAVGAPHGAERNRLHLHLADGPRDQKGTIALCEKFGARLRGNGHIPENSYAAMADVAGDEFCVIEDGNSFLAGCGPLAEVTCEGTRTVGLFWSQALGWPLVWDQDEETAVQSPAGGTKVSWGGEDVSERAAQRQYFILTVARDQLHEEIDRLLALGASSGSVNESSETLRDPDGNTFVLRPY